MLVRTGEPSDASFVVEMARFASAIEDRPLVELLWTGSVAGPAAPTSSDAPGTSPIMTNGLVRPLVLSV